MYVKAEECLAQRRRTRKETGDSEIVDGLRYTRSRDRE